MCLSVVARVESIEGEEAVVVLNGVRKAVDVGLLKDTLRPGDWVLVHTGYAISVVDEEEAEEMLRAMRSMERL